MARPDNSSDLPGKDEFAQMIADALRGAGEDRPLRYDEEQFQLVAGEESTHLLNLANAYREYGTVAPDRRDAVVRRFVRAWFAHRRELPASLEDACPDLLPAVRSRSYFELGQLQVQARGIGELDWPYRPLAEHLGVSLVYDLPDSIFQLQRHHLDDWKVPFEEALEAAGQNLWEISQHQFDSPAPGVWVSPWRDNHDAARLLLADLILGHEVAGDPVAMVPNRDTLLLTGSEDEEGLVRLASLAEEALEKPRPVSGLAVRLDGDRWVPFLPEEGHPAHDALKLLWVQSIGQDYGEQKELLEALHQKRGEDVFVASYSALQNKETGRVRSYCVWSEGVDSLLPRTDQVFFFRAGEGEDKGDVVAGGDWERVREVVGELLTPLDVYPERYRVRQFPTPEQLRAIGR